MTLRLSVIAPVYRGEATVGVLRQRLVGVLEKVPDLEFELLLVDDASPDGSWDAIVCEAAADDRVVGVRLGANVGQVRAILVAAERVGGDCIVVLDADLEDPPEGVVGLIGKYREGHDLVVARRRGRRRDLLRTIGSRGANVVARLAGLPTDDIGSSFLLMSRPVEAGVRRVVNETGRQMVLGPAFAIAELPCVHDVVVPDRAPSSYPLAALVRLGGELVVADLGPRGAPPCGVAAAAAAAMALTRRAQHRSVRPWVGLALLAGGAGLLARGVGRFWYRRDPDVPLAQVAEIVGGGLSDPVVATDPAGPASRTSRPTSSVSRR